MPPSLRRLLEDLEPGALAAAELLRRRHRRDTVRDATERGWATYLDLTDELEITAEGRSCLEAERAAA